MTKQIKQDPGFAREIQRRVFACMETGNHGQARTVLRELNEVDPELAKAIQSDVVAAYGINL